MECVENVDEILGHPLIGAIGELCTVDKRTNDILLDEDTHGVRVVLVHDDDRADSVVDNQLAHILQCGSTVGLDDLFGGNHKISDSHCAVFL